MTTNTTYEKSIFTKGMHAYFRNLLDAVIGIQWQMVEKVPEPVEVIKLDPRGISKAQVDKMKLHTRGYYKLNDSLESVAYRQGQTDLIRYVETKLIAGAKNKIGTTDHYELIQ